MCFTIFILGTWNSIVNQDDVFRHVWSEVCLSLFSFELCLPQILAETFFILHFSLFVVQQKRDYGKLQCYSPFGLLLLGKVGRLVVFEESFKPANRTLDSPVGTPIRPGDFQNIFGLFHHVLRRYVEGWNSCYNGPNYLFSDISPETVSSPGLWILRSPLILVNAGLETF